MNPSKYMEERETTILTLDEARGAVDDYTFRRTEVPLSQISLNGDLIKIWDSIKTMQKETGFNTFGIISCCKKRKKYKTAYGYKWEYV